MLVGPADADDRSINWGCFLMAPWPGRLEGGILSWHGVRYQLPRNHGRHAIHGVVFDRRWNVERAGSSDAELSCRFDPGSWPLGGSARQRIRLDAGGITLTGEIAADRSMPAALGWHPWFLRGQGDPRLRVRSDAVLVTQAMIPTGEVASVAGKTDLRRGPALGSRRLDHAYVNVGSPATISWPDLELAVEFEPPVSVVTVFTPLGAFCVEPQTARANALGLAGAAGRAAGAVVLEAGESLTATMRIAWRVPAVG